MKSNSLLSGEQFDESSKVESAIRPNPEGQGFHG